MVDFPNYKAIQPKKIAKRVDGVTITAIAKSRLGLVVRLTDKENKQVGEDLLLDSLLNHTPDGVLTWEEDAESFLESIDL